MWEVARANAQAGASVPSSLRGQGVHEQVEGCVPTC